MHSDKYNYYRSVILLIFKLLLNSAISNYSAGVSHAAAGTTALQACPSESWDRTVYQITRRSLAQVNRILDIFHYKYSLYPSSFILHPSSFILHSANLYDFFYPNLHFLVAFCSGNFILCAYSTVKLHYEQLCTTSRNFTSRNLYRSHPSAGDLLENL